MEYSPESFTGTEPEFAAEICNAVLDIWQPTEKDKAIINLPVTVSHSMPHVYANQVEYMCKNLKYRENFVVSLHPHNDRGCAVADSEMGLLAGGDRIEGTLFGNGERTGNVDIITLALNMYSQGVDPELDFSNLPEICATYEKVTRMHVYERQPYSGALVFAAFSGSHQDAIRKGMAARVNMEENAYWDVPYLTFDPHDIGRQYEGIIRINSQSGKGGAAFIMEQDYGLVLPKAMHPVFGGLVKDAADKAQRELKPAEIYNVFEKTWLNTKSPLNILEITEKHIEGERGSNLPEQVAAMATIEWNGKKMAIAGNGNGPLDAFVNGLKQTDAPKFNITSFHEHSVGTGSDTCAVAYVQITKENGEQVWGVGKSSNVGRAGIAAVVSALNFKA